MPGGDKGVGLLRRTLGEVTVPLRALAGISFEPLADGSDAYRLAVANDRGGVAEYFVDEVRNAMLLERVETGPVDAYLLPGPSLPITVGAGDATVTFDGERVRLEWNWKTEESKASGGDRTLAVADVRAVEWLPAAGLENGYLRFRTGGTSAAPPAPKYDPHAVEL